MIFISQHSDITESDLFTELPPALQHEIYEVVLWAQPASQPRRSTTTEQLLRMGNTPPSSLGELGEELMDCLRLREVLISVFIKLQL